MGHKWTRPKKIGRSTLSKLPKHQYVGIETEPKKRRYLKSGNQKFYLEDNQVVWYIVTKELDPDGTVNSNWWNKFVKAQGDQFDSKRYIGSIYDDTAITTIIKTLNENEISLDILDPNMSKKELYSLANAIPKLM